MTCWPDTTGMFVLWLAYGIKDCTDGTSNTIIYAESLVAQNSNPQPAFQRNNGVTGVSAISTFAAHDASASSYTLAILPAIQACTLAYRVATTYPGGLNTDNGIRWGIGGVGTALMNTVVTPNSKLAPFNTCTYTGQGNFGDMASFSNCQSNHPGGANVLLSDGSVRFIKDSIQQQVWFALGTRANGDIVDASQY